MDYQRIYTEFIADRQAKPEPSGFSERHHIVPRSFGGGNERANLISLTPEDHIFAHLLLAKAFGGRMWAPINVMLKNWARQSIIPTRREIRIAAKARVEHGLAMAGSGNPFHGQRHSDETISSLRDRAEYELRSFDGQTARGNRLEIERLTGLSQKSISRVLTGGRKSAGIWYSPIHNPDGADKPTLLSKAIAKPDLFALHHHDGRKWRGTRADFAAQFGATLYFQSEGGNCLGWYKSEAGSLAHTDKAKARAAHASSARGDIGGTNNPMAGSDRRKDMTVLLIHKDGERYEGSLKTFADERGISAATYGRMRKTLMGKKVVDGNVVKSFWGWRLVDANSTRPVQLQQAA